ncbi:hypothetical protein FBZ90_12348 [Nitrospirillum pindoramense]|uniref:DUF2285 domain-containing protein n=1 Tax=Nitrospirillum amazonense TaxID=28077 RepID=A0A560GLR9_9PROT|nr:hypothetical protein FBZ90_12348 [Nitrospirillum amazonense]
MAYSQRRSRTTCPISKGPQSVTRSPVNPGPVADLAPSDTTITDYDRKHFATYLMLLDAVRDGRAIDDIIREVLQINSQGDRAKALRAYDSHLARARWMAEHGREQLHKSGRDRRVE